MSVIYIKYLIVRVCTAPMNQIRFPAITNAIFLLLSICRNESDSTLRQGYTRWITLLKAVPTACDGRPEGRKATIKLSSTFSFSCFFGLFATSQFVWRFCCCTGIGLFNVATNPRDIVEEFRLHNGTNHSEFPAWVIEKVSVMRENFLNECCSVLYGALAKLRGVMLKADWECGRNGRMPLRLKKQLREKAKIFAAFFVAVGSPVSQWE